MPSTIVLTAVPAKFVPNNSSGTQTLIIKPFGKKYGLAVLGVTTLKEIKEAVGHFAEQIHRRFPNYSFAIAAKIRDGDPTRIASSKMLPSDVRCLS